MIMPFQFCVFLFVPFGLISNFFLVFSAICAIFLIETMMNYYYKFLQLYILTKEKSAHAACI